MDHHYIPQFYLKRWARMDGHLSVMRLVHGGKVALSSKHPAGTGYQSDLYRTEGVSEDKAQHLEINFMGPLDNAGNRALDRILSLDTTEWNGKDQKAWTIFLLSLMFRNPETVEELRSAIAEIWHVALGELEADYENRRLPDYPETFAEFAKRVDPATPQIVATNFIMETIANDRIGPGLAALHWSVIRTPPSVHSFITSDRPIVRPLPLSDPAAYLALPVDPHTLFIASKQWGLEKELSTYPQSTLVDYINYAVMSQARQFVWAVDEAQIENVRKYIASTAAKPILSKVGRERAVQVARGSKSLNPDEPR